jgi:DNA-binding CsgD family transcriptional regulator
VIIAEDQYLAHYGILRKSGRYPWGSGGSQSTRNRSYLDHLDMLRKQGLSDTEIARGLGITRNQLTAARTIALNQQTQERINQAQRLKDKGLSNSAIGERMGGLNESTVRSLLAPGRKDRAAVLTATADMLERQVQEKKWVDVGRGVEASLPISDGGRFGISKDKMQAAIGILEEKGYKVHTLKTPQVTAKDQQTTYKVLAMPGTTQKDAWLHRREIQQINEYSEDSGHSWFAPKPPISVSSRRVGVNYAEDGGGKADGVIYVRPGVKDLSLGSAKYAQVRIAVDGTHYLKGMAMYKDDLPEGTDLVFNTNKASTGRKKDAMKEMEKDIHGNVDENNPFGAQIKRQITTKDSSGKEKVSSAMNIINEEGDWETWSKSISSQVLSKQTPALAKTQLNMTYERRVSDFEAINSLTNPAVKKKLLETFADETDAAAVDLKAISFPSQATKVILPISSLKPSEIYAPTYRDGTRLALVRFPHGGTFEIPELTVNNRNREAKKLIGVQAPDAIGIHHKVAERLSGADFDGDHVLTIPNARGTIKTSPPLEGLKGFDPHASFPKYPGMIPINAVKGRDQIEMGKITNLIADMTIKGATDEEKARAIRHSMVVIDADKHELDYKGSAAANGIAQLKTKYQGSSRSGASTLITRAGAEQRVEQRKPRRASMGGPVDPVTGKKVFEPTGRTFVNRKGEVVKKTVSSKRLAETDDAFTLSSGTPIELEYAEHSNKLKSLANQARKESVGIKPAPRSPSATKVYANEVASLDAKLNIALKNAPLERQAQVIADAQISQKRQANPEMDESTLKKVKNQTLAEARVRTGAGKTRIEITQKEWDAIQAGAISNHKLSQILTNSDLDTVKKLATPKPKATLTGTQRLRAQQMLKSGYTQIEVADQLGIPLSTLKVGINE